MLLGKLYSLDSKASLIHFNSKSYYGKWFFSILIIFLMQVFPQTLSSQQKGIYKSGDVLFENPLEKFDLPPTTANIEIFQDSKGFIWFANSYGLFRYDGYQFREFLETPIGINDLSSTNITTVVEDEFGYLWVGCYRKGGVLRYDPRTEKFLKFPRPGNDPEVIDDKEIFCVLPDYDGNVWVGLTGYYPGSGLFKYSYETDSFKEYLNDTIDPASIFSNDIFSGHLDNYNNIWFSTENGLMHFNPENEKFTLFDLHIEGGTNLPFLTMDINEDKNGNLWIYNFGRRPDFLESSLVKISDRRDQLEINSNINIESFAEYKRYPLEDQVWFGDCDQAGNFWCIAVNKGIIRFDSKQETYEMFEPDKDNLYSLSATSNTHQGVTCDNSGAMWFGIDGGFQRYTPTKRKFTFYDHVFFELPEEERFSVNSVYEDPEGILWIASDLGLYKYDPITLKLKIFKPDPTGNNLIRNLLKDNNGNLYCTGRNAFYIFDLQKEIFSEISYSVPWSQNEVKVWPFCMIQDKNGFVWLGSNPSTYKIDPVKKSLDFPLYERGTGGIAFAIFQDDRERIWIGTEFGLNIYYPHLDSIIPIRHNPKNPIGLAAPQISAILQDSNGNMWIGTRSNGLSYLDASYLNKSFLNPDSLRFIHYSKDDGLSDIHIRGLIEDGKGDIWIASYSSIQKLDPESLTFTSYSKADGIDIKGFDRNFTHNPNTGRIYLGGISGLISFHPDSMPLNTYVPPVVLTDLRINNNSVPISDTSPLKQSISYTDRIELSYKENFLEFEFAALDFTSPEENMYKYRMFGVDPDTVYSGTKRTAEYRDLKPAEYTFWVTGSNNDGLWNPEGIELTISIHPPWYGTKMAKASYGIAILLLLSGLLRWRTYSLRKDKETLLQEVELRTEELRNKNEKIREMDGLKTRFFTDISHEIRTPLSLILGPIDNLMNEQGDSYRKKEWLNLMKRNGQRLMQLIDQLLDISRLDEGKMSLIMIEENVIQYLRVLINEFQSMAEAKNIQYVVDISVNEYISWYDRDKLTKVITNLLLNAIKFTPENGIVTCRIKIVKRKIGTKPDYLKIVVADTGIGISHENLNNIFTRFYRGREAVLESSRGTGIGLSLVKELVGIMHGKINVKSRPKTGTIFIIEVPLGIDHLPKDEFVQREIETVRENEEILEKNEQSMLEEEDYGEKTTKYEILVVEDNLDLREFIKEILTPMYGVLETDNGDLGLKLAFENIPDLILTDIMMPGIDGIELCSRIKKDERTSHIPVIMLTARSTSEQKINGLEIGADDYITKPFKIEELNVRIHNLLEQREKLRKKFTSLIGFDFEDIEIDSKDEKYLKRITGIIDENMGDFDFDVGRLQEELGISRVHLYRKLKALTDMSPSELIRVMRLKMASKLLQQYNRNVTAIAFKVGFSNPSYFSKCFREHFGKSPKEYAMKRKNK